MALLCPDVWLLQSRFKFLNVAKVGLNGLVLRTSVAGSPRLVLVNPPKMTPEVTAPWLAAHADAGFADNSRSRRAIRLGSNLRQKSPYEPLRKI